MAAATASRAGVGARKAWFFGDRSVTCLGAGITSPRSTDAPVRTTLAQRLLAGAARYGVGDESRTVGPDTVIEDRPVDWLHHDGIGYAFPERTPATVSTRVQEGSWYDINHTEEDDPVSRPVFSSWIDHGVSPDEETYAYVLRPGTDADAMPGVATDPGVTIIANDPAVQGVRLRDAGVVGAVFYEPGDLDQAGGPTISVDDGCLLQLREGPDGTTATVADPSLALESVTVSVGDRSWAVSLADCGQGRDAGTTVSLGTTDLGFE